METLQVALEPSKEYAILDQVCLTHNYYCEFDKKLSVSVSLLIMVVDTLPAVPNYMPAHFNTLTVTRSSLELTKFIREGSLTHGTGLDITYFRYITIV